MNAAEREKIETTLKLTTPSDREIVMTRSFDAPRRRVFEAMTRPEHLKRWYGPPEWSLAECEIDLVPGGAWRYYLSGPRGAGMTMRGVYQQVVAPERFVLTESYDGWEEAGVSLNTVTLDERDGRTMVKIAMLYPRPENRDAILATPTEEGAAASFDRLDSYLETM